MIPTGSVSPGGTCLTGAETAAGLRLRKLLVESEFGHLPGLIDKKEDVGEVEEEGVEQEEDEDEDDPPRLSATGRVFPKWNTGLLGAAGAAVDLAAGAEDTPTGGTRE